jgi:hypothetical protein
MILHRSFARINDAGRNHLDHINPQSSRSLGQLLELLWQIAHFRTLLQLDTDQQVVIVLWAGDDGLDMFDLWELGLDCQ